MSACGKAPINNLADVSRKIDRLEDELNTLPLKNMLGHQIFIQFYTRPSTAIEGKMLLQVVDDQGNLYNDYDLELDAFLWMKMSNGKEHGSSPLTIKKTAPGLFYLSEMFFIMNGKWELHLTLKNATNSSTLVHYIEVPD